MDYFIISIIIITTALTISKISYKAGHLKGQIQAKEEFLKMLKKLERKDRLERLAGRGQIQEESQ